MEFSQSAVVQWRLAALMYSFIQEQQCRGGASHLTEQEEATAAEAATIPPPQETDRPAVTAESKNTCLTVKANDYQWASAAVTCS